MGLFSWIKGLFNKTIRGSRSGKELIYLATKSSTKIGTDIEVKPGYAGIVLAKGVVCDVFPEGRYRLEPKEMPLASRKLNLTKPNRKGVLPNKFSADIYFVNLNLFEDTFKSKYFVKASGDGFKNLKASLAGKYSFKIVNPIDFLEAMMTQYGIISDQIAKEEISEWVSALCVRIVQKNKPSVYELFNHNENCFKGVGEYVNSELYDCGIRLEFLEITEAIFPKKIQKFLSQKYYLDSQNKPENPVEFAYERNFENQSAEVYSDEAEKIEDDMSQSTYTVDSAGNRQTDNFADSPIYQSPISQSAMTTTEQTTEQREENYNNYGSQSEQIQAPIQKTITYKKCKNCGAINSAEAHTCFSCKNSFDN